MYSYFIKRMIDILLSFLGLIILSPLILIITIGIKIDSKGPVIFKQKRIGKDKEFFYIYKFRTMIIDTPKDSPTHMLRDSKNYITKFGLLLRKTSLDELPQLVNIIKGEMSIVGPRPALWNQYDLIRAREAVNANKVLPGLTGWAQINGRDELETLDKARLDGDYIKNISFSFDLKCFVGTIIKVLRKDGIIEGDLKNIEKKRLNK